MTYSLPQTRPCRDTPRGFALIATISVMVLLVMIALAMLSLSTITLRSSRQDTHIQEAQANARLALILAIGELQASLGPDQRVTATGSLWAAPKQGTEHLVGVWNSEDNDGFDTDGDGEPDGDGHPDGGFVRWLVSRANMAEVENIEMVDTAMPISQSGDGYTTDDGYEVMVGGGSVAQDPLFPDVMQGVVAQKVNLLDDHGDSVGRYAWWEGDEGVKARVNQLNEQTDPALASQAMQRAAVEAVTDFNAVEGRDLALNKVVGLPSLGLVTGVLREPLLQRFHDMSAHSLGLQTNTRDGGLKTDLSLLFEMSDDDYQGLNPADYAAYVNLETPVSLTDNIPKGILFYDDAVHATAIDGEGVFGPTIDLLRNHYRQYKSITGTGSAPLSVARASMPNKMDFNPAGGDGASVWHRTASKSAWHKWLKSDPNTSSTMAQNNVGNVTVPTPRLLRGNVSPYLNRVVFYASVEAEKMPEVSEEDPVFYRINKLKLQPILYVHKPYNVRMSVEKMRYVRLIDKKTSLNIDRRDEYAPKYEDSDKNISGFEIGELLKQAAEKACKDGDEVQFIIDPTTPTIFEPGEMKIFVLDGGDQQWGQGMKMVELTSSFSPGSTTLSINISDMPGYDDPMNNARRLTSNIPFGTELRMRVFWTFNSEDHFEIWDSDALGYNTLWSAYSLKRHSYATGNRRTDGPLFKIEDLLSTTPITVDDYFVKPLRFNRYKAPVDIDAAPTYPSSVGYPSFVLGNPLCSSDSNTFHTGWTPKMPGSVLYSTMHHLYMGAISDYTYLTNNVLSASNYGTWGNNNGPMSGQRFSIMLEVPTAPLFSLGGLQHANIAVDGHQPALAIGNSFPNLAIASYSELTRLFGQHKSYDLSYMANRALWDRYFFSSITPRPGDASYSSLTEDPQTELDQVIGDFVEGTGKLGNPRMVLGAQASTRAKTVTTLNDYKTNAAMLGMKGAFNINSTSVEAWKAVLSGYRNAAMRVGAGVEIDASTSALPHFTRSLISAKTDPLDTEKEAWQAYAKLDDTKIEALAQAIVEGIKSRATMRTGPGPVTPALTLGQFVNRMIEGTLEMQQRGVLQAAIEKSKINGYLGIDVADPTSVFDTDIFNELEGDEFPESCDYDLASPIKIPAALGAPASVLQSDILQAIGASISARSDTFRIRAYGESLNGAGEVVAKAWAEAIVQRTTRPVDPDPANEWEFDPDPARVTDFGRRFKMISFRWLRKNEI